MLWEHALGVVHSDVCGPFPVPSLGGNKYFVSFVDEFTRMTWVTLIKFKHEVFTEFQKFKVNVEIAKTECLSAEGSKGDSKLWQKRLGHLNYRSLGHLSSKKLVCGIPKIVKPEKSCEVCMKGKQTRLPFVSKVAPRAKHALGVLYSNVCGPFPEPSLGGNRYFVSFMDEFTRMTWVTLIKVVRS